MLLKMTRVSQTKKFPWCFYFGLKSNNTDFEILTGLGPSLSSDVESKLHHLYTDPFQSYFSTLLHPVQSYRLDGDRHSSVLSFFSLTIYFSHFRILSEPILLWNIRQVFFSHFHNSIMDFFYFILFMMGSHWFFKLCFCVMLAFLIISLPDGRKRSITRCAISVVVFWPERTQFWLATYMRGKNMETAELKKHFTLSEKKFKSLYL